MLRSGSSGRADEDVARAEVDEHQPVRNLAAKQRDHALGEEVARDRCAHLLPDELAPDA